MLFADAKRHRARQSVVQGLSDVALRGLSPAELAVYVRQVAAECDRLEYLLTGEDRE